MVTATRGTSSLWSCTLYQSQRTLTRRRSAFTFLAFISLIQCATSHYNPHDYRQDHIHDDNLQHGLLLRSHPGQFFPVPEPNQGTLRSAKLHRELSLREPARERSWNPTARKQQFDEDNDDDLGGLQIVLHLNQGETAKTVELLRKKGFEIAGYIPHNAVYLHITNPETQLFVIESTVPNIRWIGIMREEWKHDSHLLLESEVVTGHDPSIRDEHVAYAANPFLHFTILLCNSKASAIVRKWNEKAERVAAVTTSTNPATSDDDSTTAFPRSIRAIDVRRNVIHARVVRADARLFLAMARKLHSVHWIERRYPKKFHNYQAAKSILGEERGGGSDDNESHNLIWEKGINGSGQIVGIHDTGLDTSHCFFRDQGTQQQTNSSPTEAISNNDDNNDKKKKKKKKKKTDDANGDHQPSGDELYYLQCNATRLSDKDDKIVIFMMMMMMMMGGAHYTPYINLTTKWTRKANVSLAYDVKYFLAALTGNESLRQSPTQDLVDEFCPLFSSSSGEGEGERNLQDVCCGMDPYGNEGNSSVMAQKGFDLPLRTRALALALLHNGITCCPNSKSLENMDYTKDATKKECWKKCKVLVMKRCERLRCAALDPGREFADSGDRVDGHGTHVSGSVAGYAADPSAPINKYKGIAPAAIITLIVQGDSSNRYNYDSSLYDELIYEKQDMLILFAAGNDGDSGYGSLGSQANAKNVSK
eukprot:jgi/Bigna1/143683/aug1.80_g18391